MWHLTERPVFRDRDEAGRRLAERLAHYKGTDAILLAIPRGGVQVAFPISRTLDLPLDVLVVRKLPIPWSPEMGMGAVTAEGETILEEGVLERLGMSPEGALLVAEKVRLEVQRRERLYRGGRPSPQLRGRVAILVDDGLATGFTMLAAIRSVRKQAPRQVVVAVPTASAGAVEKVRPEADELVALVVAGGPVYAVADYYERWYDLTDEEILALLGTGKAAARG